MIEISVVNLKTRSRADPRNVLNILHERLDKQKFFGSIVLKYEAGALKYIKCEENFTVDGLVEHLNL